MQKRKLKSVSDIIKVFGGTKKAAEWAGTGMPMISNWLAAGEIPNGWHYRIHMEMLARGFEVCPSVFGVKVVPGVGVKIQRTRQEYRA